MPKRKKASRRAAGTGRPPVRVSESVDPFAGLAARVQQAASPRGLQVDLAEALARMEVENARIDEAKTLLQTAADLLAQGREADARGVASDALRLAPIDHGEISCAGMAAHMMIGDEIEAQGAAAVDDHDSAWIERALALVPRFTGPEANDIRLAVSAVNDYRLGPNEQQRVNEVIGAGRSIESPLETVSGTAQQVEVLLSLMRALSELRSGDSNASRTR